jgi:hypothetical protein
VLDLAPLIVNPTISPLQTEHGEKVPLFRLSLRATLSRTMEEARNRPSTTASTWRVESILIEAERTTIVVSGNRAGLVAAATALKKHSTDVRVAKASVKDARPLLPAQRLNRK